MVYSSIRFDEGLTLETWAFRIPVRWSIYIINSVDKTKFLFTTPPPNTDSTSYIWRCFGAKNSLVFVYRCFEINLFKNGRELMYLEEKM